METVHEERKRGKKGDDFCCGALVGGALETLQQNIDNCTVNNHPQIILPSMCLVNAPLGMDEINREPVLFSWYTLFPTAGKVSGWSFFQIPVWMRTPLYHCYFLISMKKMPLPLYHFFLHSSLHDRYLFTAECAKRHQGLPFIFHRSLYAGGLMK